MSMDTEESVDYADFTYETLQLQVSQDSSGNGTLVAQYEPMADRGGLRPNQVAEIVAVSVDIQGTSAEAVPSGNGADTYEVRGTFGINLDDENDATSQSNGTSAESLDVVNGSFINTESGQLSETGILQPFRVTSQDGQLYEKHYRDLVGRGPVVDSNDDLSIILTAVSEAADSNDFQMNIHLIYDLYELDDARTEFSLPR